MSSQEPKLTRLRCFLALPAHEEYRPVRDAIRKGVRAAGSRVVTSEAETIFEASVMGSAQEELVRADCIIADVSGSDPNVYFQVGLAQAMGKGLFICANRNSLSSVPSTLRDLALVIYDPTISGLADLASNITEALRRFRRSPRRARLFAQGRYALPFSIDWDQLERPEAENLCQELLAQMGYQKVDWAKGSPEIDLIAELPRKDPDGFEYRELWLVSMGQHMPPEFLLDWAQRPDYLVHRIGRRGDRLLERMMLRGQGGAPLTILVILFDRDPGGEEAERLRAKLSHESRFKEGPYGTGIRFRLWDRTYLTSLVQQFPQIGYKYFSDEARAQSKYRKTPAELYKENVALSDRQAQLIRDLEDEKNKRVRAERDAIWKDISFSAAHKIGNPIFAIETDLDPLDKRVREARMSEALEVVGNVRASVEKAKAIIDQFKSLTRAQEIKLSPIPLKPVLEDALRAVRNQEVNCTIDCSDDLLVYADPERLAECFEELVVNCTHWYDKDEKTLTISAGLAKSLPAALDSARQYAVVHVKDNGVGVPLEHKTKIFDAFFTTHEHGTGLGLALVRRIVDGHGGMITENGTPGKGADFEVYLPTAPAPAAQKAPSKKKKAVVKKKKAGKKHR